MKIYNCLYMTSQHLRKVSVGQKPHKHEFPELENYQNLIFGEIEICQENRNLAGGGGDLGGAAAPPGYFLGSADWRTPFE